MDKKNPALVRGEKYQGKYVALTSTGKKAVVASGFKLSAVIKKARREGVEAPPIVFVPKKGVTSLY